TFSDLIHTTWHAIKKYGLPQTLDIVDLARTVDRLGGTLSLNEAAAFVDTLLQSAAHLLGFMLVEAKALLLAALARAYMTEENMIAQRLNQTALRLGRRCQSAFIRVLTYGYILMNQMGGSEPTRRGAAERFLKALNDLAQRQE